MKRIILPFFGLCLAFFMSCCSGETHFITDESYRARVAQDLEQKKTLLPKCSDIVVHVYISIPVPIVGIGQIILKLIF